MRLGFVMTCYNDADLVGEAILDLQAQTYRDAITIVVNNGSTDNSAQAIADMANPYYVLGVTSLKQNTPHSHALNHGAWVLSQNDCAWFVVQNSDDRCYPGYAQAIVDTATAHPDCNCIFSPWEHMDDGRVQRFPLYDPATMIDVHQIPGIRAVRRDLWEATGGEDEAIPAGADWDWAVRASMCGMVPRQLERPYVRIRPRTNRPSLSSQVDFPRLTAHMRAHRPGAWAQWNT